MSRVNAAEWIMAGATVVTGMFVAWQSLLLRESLGSPFSANLQDRQIAVCAASIKAKGALRSYGGWADNFRSLKLDPPAEPSEERQPSFTPLDDEMVINPDAELLFDKSYEWGFQSNFSLSSSSMAEMRASLAELRIYSDAETIEEIDSLESSLTLKTIADSIDASDEAWLDDVSTKFSPIEAKCRAVMLGEKKGLI